MQWKATHFVFLNVCSTWAPPKSSFVSLSSSHGPRISWHWGEYGHRIMNGSRFWTLSITLFILEPLFIIFHQYTLSNNLYCADNSGWETNTQRCWHVNLHSYKNCNTVISFYENDILIIYVKRRTWNYLCLSASEMSQKFE